MKSWREWVIKYGTYVVVFLTPILYFGAGRYIPYATSKTFFFYGAVELIFAIWLFQLFVDHSYRLTKKDLIIFTPLLLYIAWFTIAAIFGVDPGMSLWSSLGRATGLLTVYHVTAFVFIVASLVKKYGLAKYGYKLLAWFVGGASILAISVWLGNEGFNLPVQVLEKSKGGGLIGNSSLAATVLLFAVFFEIFLISAKDIARKYKIIFSILLALIIFSPLFVSLFGAISARGAMFGIAAGAVAFLPFYLGLSKIKTNKIIASALILIGLVAFAIGWNSLMTPNTKVHQTFSQLSGESRFIFWNIGEEAMKARPVLGYGPENYNVAYQQHFDPQIFTLSTTVEVWNDRAHNVFFDIGATSGWPGIAAYIIFLASLLYYLYTAFTNGKISRAQASILGSLIIAYFAQNLFVFDSLYSLMTLAILSGIIFGLNMSGDTPKDKNNLTKSKKSLVAVAIIIIFVPIWIVCAWLPSRKAVAFADVLTLSLDKRPDHYQDLLKGSPVGNDFEVGAVAEDAFNLYSKNQKAVKADPNLLAHAIKDLEKLTEYLEAVAVKEPNQYRLRLNLARLYNILIDFSDTDDAGFAGKALRIEEEAMSLAPNDPQIYWVTAVTKFHKGDKEGAKTLLNRAIEIAPYIDFSKELLDKISAGVEKG